MRIKNVSGAIVIALLGAASVTAAEPVRPAVASFTPLPAQVAPMDSSARVGVKHSRKSSDLTTPAIVGIALLGAAAVGGGIAAASSGGGHSDGNVSPN